MAVSTFNPEQFLATQSKQSLDTKLIPVPAGEHQAQIEPLTKKSFRKLEDKTTNEVRWILDVMWHVLDEESKKVTGLDKPLVRQSIFLDLTPEGSLDMGKGRNVQLGQLREACGQNKDGKAWAPAMLAGSICTITVEHKPDDKNPDGPPFANVKKVARG